jgi:polar amino acid transport system substrate-binding protein
MVRYRLRRVVYHGKVITHDNVKGTAISRGNEGRVRLQRSFILQGSYDRRRKSMKKKVIGGILAVAMAAGLAGCGSSSAAGSSSASASSGAAASESQAQEVSVTAQSTSASSGTASGDSDVDYIKGKGKLIVGVTDFAPMDYKDDSGNWIGFDADLATKVADDLGVDVEFVEIDWDSKILELQNKSIDVVWNGMTLTDEVTNSMECTKPYLKNAQVVVMPADKADQYPDAESMKSLNFAVETGSAGEEAAKDAGFNYSSVESQANALMEVKSGTSDACIIDLLMAGAMIGEGTDFADMVHTVELTSEEYGIGCRKGSDLAEFINQSLASYDKDGSLKELAEKYGVQESLIPIA